MATMHVIQRCHPLIEQPAAAAVAAAAAAGRPWSTMPQLLTGASRQGPGNSRQISV